MSQPIKPSNMSESDICHLLQMLNLEAMSTAPHKGSDQGIEDACMIDAQSYQPEPHAASQSKLKEPELFHGCAYLQAIQEQLGQYGTSTGDYLEAVFTHRELFLAYPPGHRACARGYRDLATMLENREWRPDRDGDMEAAGVFRHEAMMLASSPSK